MGVTKRSLLLVTIISSVLLSACFGPGPGHGAKAAVGFRVGNRAIVALDQFHAVHGFYPAKEEELIPRYLPSLDAFSYAYHGDTNSLRYRRDKDGSFTLEFGYVSGFPRFMSICYYTSKTRQWKCLGYY